MTFKELNNKMQEQFAVMQKHKLFRLGTTGQEIWDAYLGGFKPGQNPIFRDPASSEANCNNDKNFIRRYGNVVAITEDYQVISMFDINVEGSKYEDTIKGIQKLIAKSKVKEVFFETFDGLNSLPYEKTSKTAAFFQLGHKETLKQYSQAEVDKFGVVNTRDIYRFNHFHVLLNKEFVDMSGKSVESIMGTYRDNKNVFQRAMKEIPLDTLNLVVDLINQGSLLDGATHLYKVEQFIPLKREYDSLPENKKDLWCWLKSYQLPFARFKNELIGVLCSELAEGVDLNEACKSWNKRVDPANYMKAVAPITKRQIEEAKKFVEENGLEDSFNRRFATIDDIKVDEILYSNVGSSKIPSVSIFDSVKPTSTRHKRSEFDKVEEVTIEKFMKDILPGCTSVEAFFINQQKGNLVSLTTAAVPDSKPIFKWGNNYSWTFNGNLAGKSMIKEAVKTAGGAVDGVLRASMIWNESGSDNSDLDIWCLQPDGQKIGFDAGYRKDNGNKFTSLSGQLDLDNRGPGKDVGIENIYFKDLSKMKNGTYKFWVNQFNNRNSKGFKFEIEFDGETYNYVYDRPVAGNIPVAVVTLKDGQFSIEHLIPSTEGLGSSEEIYGLETNQFHKVNLVCLSPNHWDGNNVGNKHYFFMLEGCKTPTSIRGFHNENLNSDLQAHRKVMEVLGATQTIEPAEKQLTGIGFNATVKDELVVRLQGTHKRVVKIKF